MPSDEGKHAHRGWRWLPAVLLVLGAVAIATHWSEVPKVLGAIRHVRPVWLLTAIAFQAVTYAAVGSCYFVLARAYRAELPVGASVKLSLTNLFVNNAVPSAGLSGNLFLVRMMSKYGVPAGRGALVVLLERLFYFSALAFWSVVVLGWILLRRGRLDVVEMVAMAFVAAVVVGLVLTVRGALRKPVRSAQRVSGWIEKAPGFLRRGLKEIDLVGEAKRIEEAGGLRALKLPRVAACLGAETALLVADGLSLWALFHGIGSHFPAHRAVMGLVVAQLLAQVVVIPGSLEVGLAGLLTGFGARAGTAVLVAILFHLLALWLPMPLGWWFYRNAEVKTSPSRRRSRRTAASSRP